MQCGQALHATELATKEPSACTGGVVFIVKALLTLSGGPISKHTQGH